MSELLGQLGVDWKLLLSQGVNFFILFVVLTLLVWRPLLRIMHERARRIQQGLDDAEKSKQELASIEGVKSSIITEAEKKALALIAQAEHDADERGGQLVWKAEKKVEFMLKEAELILQQRKQEELEETLRAAGELVREALVSTVQLKPAHIDDALITQAVQTLQKKRI